MGDKEAADKPTFLKRKAALKVTFCVKKTRDASHKKISAILRKAEHERTEEELQYLCSGDTIVQEIKNKLLKRQRLKERLQEFEDPPEVLNEKCVLLAKAISESRHLVVYTGAGISTAARIPDYRGTNGVWTLLEQGKDIGLHDLSQAKPTLTHMALFKLYQEKILKHIVSQNCDGLHLRSGLPRSALSEIHGNMFLEVCHDCEPIRFYLRLFDVTQHTARYSHETLRLCYFCGSPLCDTIVHFGERGVLQWPLNWKTASDNANQADVILCLGSSLKVLKKYPWLWQLDKPPRKRPQLFIVNLQWTPKDEQATLKINGKCDAVLQQMMDLLNLPIPKYSRPLDPIYNHATLIHPVESHTTSKPSLKTPWEHVDAAPTLDNQKFLIHSPQKVEKKEAEEIKGVVPVKTELVVNAKSENAPDIKIEGVEVCKNSVLVNGVFLDDGVDFCGVVKEESVKTEVSVKVKTESSFVSTVKVEDSDVHESTVFVNSVFLDDHVDFCGIVKEESIEVELMESDPLQNKEQKLANSIILKDVKKQEESIENLVENDSLSNAEGKIANRIVLLNSTNFRSVKKQDVAEDFTESESPPKKEQKLGNSITLNDGINARSEKLTENFAENDPLPNGELKLANSIILDDGMNFCEIVEQTDYAEEDFEETDPLQIGERSSDESVIFNYELMDLSSVDLALGAVETVGISIPADFDEVYWQIRENLIETAGSGDSFKDQSVILGNCDTQNDTHSLKTDIFNADEALVASLSDDKAIESCDFCRANYGSPSCLFYVKFTDVTPNFEERCCLCCENSEDSAAKERVNSQTGNVNPGWFGKGYRKKIKKKRRD